MVPGPYRNKRIVVTANTTVDVSADYLWVTNGVGGFKLLSGLSAVGASIAANGAINQLATGLTAAAATWYYVWGVCKSDGTGVGVVIGTSPTTPPTLPTGYSGGYYAYMGALRTAAGSAQLMGTMQFGRKLRFVVGLAQTTASIAICSGAVGTPNTNNPVLVATQVRGNGFMVPPHISFIRVSAWTSYKAAAGSSVQCATSLSYSGTNNGPTGTSGNMPAIMVSISVNMGDRQEVMLESDNLYYAGQAGGVIILDGWEEND